MSVQQKRWDGDLPVNMMYFLNQDPRCRELFENLPEDMVSQLPVMEVEKDSTIIESGTYANRVYIVLSGVCAIVKKSRTSEKPIILNRLGYLDIAGLYEIIRDISRVGHVIALTKCTLATIEREQLEKWMTQYPQFVIKLASQISDRYFNHIDYLNYYIKYSSKCALISFFLEQYQLLSSPFGPEKRSIQILETRAELSEEIGRDIRSVNRCIHELKVQGLISTKSGKIIISKEQIQALTALREELSNQ